MTVKARYRAKGFTANGGGALPNRGFTGTGGSALPSDAQPANDGEGPLPNESFTANGGGALPNRGFTGTWRRRITEAMHSLLMAVKARFRAMASLLIT